VEEVAVRHPVRAHTKELVNLATLDPSILERVLLEVLADKSEAAAAVEVVVEFAFLDVLVMDIASVGLITVFLLANNATLTLQEVSTT